MDLLNLIELINLIKALNLDFYVEDNFLTVIKHNEDNSCECFEFDCNLT